ncbi:hypothetical protein BXQ17_07870 [Polaribacter sp. BM10]|nr:hypothetical protein BXQ17_07870 [Polaribacter sp. BM10]
MKSRLTFLLFLLILISCGRNKYEKKIIGKWYDIKENSKLEFDKDSLTISEPFYYKGIWKANENKVKFSYNNMFNDSIKKNSFTYKLHNDTLFFKSDLNPLSESFFIKAESFTQFLFKKNKVNINLGKNKNAEYQGPNTKYGIKIFIESWKKSTIIKTEYSNNLENLENDLEKKLNSLNPYFKDEYNDYMKERMTYEKWIRINIFYSLFVDENISEDIVKNIVEKLRKTRINKIYRVYKTEEEYGIPFDNLKEIKL